MNNNNLLIILNELEKIANEHIDQIPEVFNSIEDMEEYTHFSAVLQTVKLIKKFMNLSNEAETEGPNEK